jgi:hypothetical protein
MEIFSFYKHVMNTIHWEVEVKSKHKKGQSLDLNHTKLLKNFHCKLQFLFFYCTQRTTTSGEQTTIREETPKCEQTTVREQRQIENQQQKENKQKITTTNNKYKEKKQQNVNIQH